MNAPKMVVAAMLILAAATGAFPQNYRVYFGDSFVEAYVGQRNVAVPIALRNSEPVEYIHLIISYDASLITPRAVAPAIFFQLARFNINTPGRIEVELERDLIPPPYVPPIPPGDTVVAYISMDVIVNDLGRDLGTFIEFIEDPNTPYPDNLLLLANGYFIIPPQLVLQRGEFYIFRPLYGDLNLNGDTYEVGDVVTFVGFFTGAVHFGPRQMANSDCNRDNLQATIADLVYMLRIINGDPDTLLFAPPEPIDPDRLAEQLLAATAKSTKILDNYQMLSIFLDSKEPLGGFAFSLLLPDYVNRVGDLALGESAGNLLLAFGETEGILKIVGYSMRAVDLPSGMFKAVDIEISASRKLNVEDFKIVSADFSDAHGNKIDVAYRLSAPPDEERIHNLIGEDKRIEYDPVAYPNPFNSAVTIAFGIERTQRVSAEIFDILGRRVAVIAEGEFQRGEQSLVWNGRDFSGDPVSTGVYFCRLHIGDEEKVVRLQYLK